MARFFLSENAISDGLAVITGPDVKHIGRVLRLEPGAGITLLTGKGTEFEATIREINNREVTCEITGTREVSAESPVRVVLYQGLSKGDKMELVIQKSTELGVARIVPLISERTVVRLDEKKAAHRLARWQRVAEEAAKQSRRSVIPQVGRPLEFRAALETISAGTLAVLPWEEEQGTGLRDILRANRDNSGDIAVFIGPEGGFSRNEVELAGSRGVFPVSLGPRIMRTETAGIVAVSVILYELGDLGGTQ